MKPESLVRPEMQQMAITDLAFGLGGSSVPADYAFELWREVVRCLPWLEGEKLAGIHPLRLAASGAGMLLPRRARLVLRLPAMRLAQASSLSGQALRVGPGVLQVGEASERPLQPHSTLHAHMVASAAEEDVFVTEVASQLREMRIGCRWICGRRHAVAGGDRTISGYSLVVHDLGPEASLQLQQYGLGEERRYGCGIFVPYKTISGLD